MIMYDSAKNKCALLKINVKNKKRKKGRGQYPASLTEQVWSIKGFLYGQNITPRLWEQSGQSRAGRIGLTCPLGLPIRTHWIRFILLDRASSHIITRINAFGRQMNKHEQFFSSGSDYQSRK